MCHIFSNFVQSDSLSFYIHAILSGLNAMHETKSMTSLKIKPIKRSRVANECCFQIDAIINWNSLPYDITC